MFFLCFWTINDLLMVSQLLVGFHPHPALSLAGRGQFYASIAEPGLNRFEFK
jgi:hypothetical protein